MERAEVLEMLSALQLSGMRAAYDEIVAAGIKRKHGIEQVIGSLLKAELAEKEARSIRMTCARSSRVVSRRHDRKPPGPARTPPVRDPPASRRRRRS